MTRNLSIVSFEGFIFDYPVEREKIQEWLISDGCLHYPNVPDIPGPTYWDSFSVDVVKEIQKDNKHDLIIMSEIESKGKKTRKRIEFLLKSMGISFDELIIKTKRESLERFYKKNVGYYLTQRKIGNKKYSEVNIYLNDFELTNMLGDSIRKSFSIKTVLHDI